MPTPRLRPYRGPAFLSYGFRPFFLLGAVHSGLSILFWLPQFYGELELETSFAPVDWHTHELLFGFVPAIVTGFLFTAVPNWTGRMPIQGTPLLALVLIWLAGRISVSASAGIGWLPAMIIDCAFLTAIAAVVLREIVAGKNWRNLKVLLPLAILLLANAVFHVEAHVAGKANVGWRLAIMATITLIMLIGGRVVPSFTRNWLARENPGRLPAPFGRIDVASIAVSVAALTIWTFFPDALPTAVLMIVAAIAQTWRLVRWAGYRTMRDPLVAILHVSYLFIPVGFALVGAAVLFPQSVTGIAGVHALGVGAIGEMTLSMMVRASLGHTGKALKAGLVVRVIFSAIVIAAVARTLAALNIGDNDIMLYLAAFAWAAAFLGFAAGFAPALLRPRRT